MIRIHPHKPEENLIYRLYYLTCTPEIAREMMRR